MRKNLTDFVKEHRAELDEAIGRVISHVPRQASCDCPKSGTDHYHDAPSLNDSERRDWVMNDESLYNWARREGVRI